MAIGQQRQNAHTPRPGGCGVAGDRFVSALLDAWPELAKTAIEAVQLFMQNQELSLRVAPADDGRAQLFKMTRQAK